MNSNSNQVSKRQGTETNTEDEEANGTDSVTVTGSTSGGWDVVISKDADVVDSVVNVFTDDILPEIFDNLEILTAQDLLHFRLVNRCWRDAATSVLLKHNLCEIALDFGDVNIDEDGNTVDQIEHWPGYEPLPDSYELCNYFNAYQPRNSLSDLNQLIAASPKFPSTSISFRSKYPAVFWDLCPLSESADADEPQHYLDLLYFLSLYGKKIKKLSLSSGETGVDAKAFQNLFYVHMPHLTCIDLHDFNSFAEDEEDLEGNSLLQVFLPAPSALEIREILLGQEQFLHSKKKFNFLKQLIRASPHLNSIREVTPSLIQVLHEMGKLHLIKDLSFDPTIETPSMQQFFRLVTDTILNHKLSSFPGLKLTKLKFEMGRGGMSSCVKNLNLFLSASKDSLEYLELEMAPSKNLVDLFIPPLSRLKYLKLVEHIGTSTRIRFLGDVIGRAVRAGQVTGTEVYDLEAITLENEENVNIPKGYIPRLSRVVLHQQRYAQQVTENNPEKMLEFFAVNSLSEDTLVFDTVSTLDLSTFPWDDVKLPKIFPNLSRLTIHCNYLMDFQNSVWTTFPNLENLKIFGLQQNWESKIVDSFLTGIAPELCEQFESQDASTQRAQSPQHVFERTKPYIGNCKNLKKFTINFGEKLHSKFASEVSAVYGFQEVVHRTKIIFAFGSLKLKAKEKQETCQYLEPVAAYIEIRIE